MQDFCVMTSALHISFMLVKYMVLHEWFKECFTTCSRDLTNSNLCTFPLLFDLVKFCVDVPVAFGNLILKQV